MTSQWAQITRSVGASIGKCLAAFAAASVVGMGVNAVSAPAAQAAIPPMPQGYPIQNLYKKCSPAKAHEAGYPNWHYGEIGRRHLSDGTIQFKNNTNQAVDYTAAVETGTNHKFTTNGPTELPSGWNTTAKTDIGASLSNGWTAGETFGPIKLQPGESFRVEYGVLEKDFIAMFVDCVGGEYQNVRGADVLRGTAPAERYAYAYIIKADGSVADQAMAIPSRGAGANSRPIEGTYTSVSGPSLEKVASPKDEIVEPMAPLRKDDDWPKQGDSCRPGVNTWFPYDIKAVAPTYRKPGYSQDFLNWSKGDYTFTPVTDFVVGAEFNGGALWMGRGGRVPTGWLESVGAIQRAYMPVHTALKPIPLKAGEKVRVEYGTTMTRIKYREITCGADGKYSRVASLRESSAPSGFWAQAVVTSPNGTTRTVDVTPKEWAHLPVPTQSAN